MTRERVPLDWATTQNNLGTALRALGEREDGTAKAGEAVAAYRAALEVSDARARPARWATTQNNLGSALETLGEREDGTQRLEQAVAAYRGGAGGVQAGRREPLRRHRRAQPRPRRGAARRAAGEERGGVSEHSYSTPDRDAEQSEHSQALRLSDREQIGGLPLAHGEASPSSPFVGRKSASACSRSGTSCRPRGRDQATALIVPGSPGSAMPIRWRRRNRVIRP